MSTEKIIRAWKDPKYRETLDPEERAMIPEHPAGIVELSDSELGAITGGVNFWEALGGALFGYALNGVISKLGNDCEFFPKTKGPQCPKKAKAK